MYTIHQLSHRATVTTVRSIEMPLFLLLLESDRSHCSLLRSWACCISFQAHKMCTDNDGKNEHCLVWVPDTATAIQLHPNSFEHSELWRSGTTWRRNVLLYQNNTSSAPTSAFCRLLPHINRYVLLCLSRKTRVHKRLWTYFFNVSATSIY